MKRTTLLLIGTAMLASGCQRAAEPASEPTPSPSATALVQAGDCAPPPTLAVSPGAQVPGETFARIETDFATAYQKACADKLFAKAPLMPIDGAHPGTLFVLNAPDANVTSIYQGDGRDMVLEYPAQTPSIDELYEAIYCAAIGASEREQEESGRCLPD